MAITQVFDMPTIDLTTEAVGTIALTATLTVASTELVTYVNDNRTYIDSVKADIDANFATLLDAFGEGFAENTAYNKNFGTTADTVTEGDDARLSDARTPLSHTHPQADVTDLVSDLAAKEPSFVKNTGFNKDFGVISGTVTEGDDARLSDARTPVAHSHVVTDTTGLQAALDAKEDTVIPNTAYNKDFGSIADTVTQGDDSRLSDARTPVAHSHVIGDTTGLQGALDAKEPTITPNTAFNKAFGTTAGTVTEGNDSRLSNARTPTAHSHAATEITSGVLADAQVSETSVTQHQAALAVTKSQISDFSVETADITASAVTYAAIQDVTNDRMLGRIAGTAGAVQEMTASDIRTLINVADGATASGAPEGTAVLSTGEVGGSKFLREDGDGTSSWQAIGGGGDLLAANNLSDLGNAVTATQNLSVEIGVDVQAYSGVLDATTASYTTADETKLAGIEASATADQTGAEIKTAYEAETDTNAFTDAEQTKLAGITTSATANDTDANLKARANHTGTQLLSTVSDAGSIASKDFWTGDQATYDGLGSWDSNTLYFVSA